MAIEITIEVEVNGTMERVWEYWTDPLHIVQWNFASAEWCCPHAENDLRPEGQFSYRMEAKDQSMGFDFEGRYTQVVQNELIEYALEDERRVQVVFEETPSGVLIREIFEAEDANSAEMQREGWQAILKQFKYHVEA